MVATAGIFLLQALASAWWLRRFRFGPMEWLWRSLTYARVQPLRRDRSVPPGGAVVPVAAAPRPAG